MSINRRWTREFLVVLQKIRGEHDGCEASLVLSLGGHSKQAGDEGDLPQNVSFFHTTHLAFPDHVHHLVALYCSPCRFQGKEAQPWFDHPFDEAVVLLVIKAKSRSYTPLVKHTCS